MHSNVLAQGYGSHPKCPCYTASTTLSNSACTFDTSTCGPPSCIMDVFLTIPTKRSDCPHTKTKTYFSNCPTACPTCWTGTSTAVGSATCLSTPTPPPPQTTTTPPASCYTVTEHSRETGCTPIPDCFTADCIIESVVTLPPSNTACPITPTVTSVTTCPTVCSEAGGCVISYVTTTATTS